LKVIFKNNSVVRKALLFTCVLVFDLFGEQVSATSNSIIPDYFYTDPDSSEQNFLNSIDALFSYYKTGANASDQCGADGFDHSKETLKIVFKDISTSFSFPFKNYITSPFGPRDQIFHSGIDIKLQTGDTIRAVFDGVVRVVSVDRCGYGKLIIIKHGKGLETLYAHLSKCIIAQNTTVSAGDVIGLGGNTGRSSGSHLHFEIRHCGEPFDPFSFLNFETYALKSDTLLLSPECFSSGFNQETATCHKVRVGDTLSRIASKYHISIAKLCHMNNITPQTVLKIGKNLVLKSGS
jgi:murein DD-endopeptidase MepM/ murein hydrolase activator NlpD